MRHTMFGDVVIESTEDDLGVHIDNDGAYAMISAGDDGIFFFEIQGNEEGEERGQSDGIFDSVDDARKYLSGWFAYSDIQENY